MLQFSGGSHNGYISPARKTRFGFDHILSHPSVCVCVCLCVLQAFGDVARYQGKIYATRQDGRIYTPATENRHLCPFVHSVIQSCLMRPRMYLIEITTKVTSIRRLVGQLFFHSVITIRKTMPYSFLTRSRSFIHSHKSKIFIPYATWQDNNSIVIMNNEIFIPVAK